MNVEQLLECEFAGETDNIGESLSPCHFAQHKSHQPRIEPEPLRWEASD